MPLEARPLFRPDVLRKHLQYFNLPASVKDLRPELSKWAGLIESNRIDSLTEKEILPDFLTVFFGKLLSYTGPADDPARYTLSREKHVEVDGKYADAVLGVFLPAGMQPIIALEGKGPKDPLDRPFGGRKMCAVHQAYRYAINLPCDWIIVTSIRHTRLYHKGSTQQSFELFDTVALAEDQRQLEKFVFLLAAERVAPLEGRCHLYDLLTASEKVGQQLTKEFYVTYADRRQDAFEQLWHENPHVGRHDHVAAHAKDPGPGTVLLVLQGPRLPGRFARLAACLVPGGVQGEVSWNSSGQRTKSAPEESAPKSASSLCSLPKSLHRRVDFAGEDSIQSCILVHCHFQGRYSLGDAAEVKRMREFLRDS
jgi:hypothetical protein